MVAASRRRGSYWRWAVALVALIALTSGGGLPAAGQEPPPRPVEGRPSANREIAQEQAAPADRSLRGAAAVEERLRKFALESVRSQGSAMSVGAGQVPGTFRVMMAIPGGVGPEVKLDVVSIGPQGGPIAPAGDPALYPDLPPPALVGENGLVLRRMQDEPWQEGFSRYLSETVVVVADLRASLAYERTAAESTMCVRCDAAAEGIPADARELLSGYAIQIRPSPELRQSLSGIYSDSALREMEQTIPSVPWDLSPSVRQEPRRNPSMGSGEVAPGTLLHSGEFSYMVTDLAVRGRGIDIAFTRTYRSGTVGSGPLGPGWELGYSVRLRELTNGDVEYYDGRGRRALFVKDGDLYRPPPGFFADLSRTPSGWVLIDAQRNLERFDRCLDRLRTETQPEQIEVTLGYDSASRLVSYTDALGHTTAYAYDALGRQTSVTYPDSTVEAYAYDPAGNLIQITQPTGSVIAFTLDAAGRRIGRAVTPGSGVFGAASEVYTLDGLGRLIQASSGSVTVARSYDSLSRVTAETVAGRTVTYSYDDAGSLAGMGYPSGHAIARGIDALGRPETIASGGTAAAAYTFRGGARIEAKSVGNAALTSAITFDPAGRLLESTVTGAGSSRIFGERLSWSPRNLKTAQARLDRNRAGLAFAYDDAGRLVLAAKHPDPVVAFPNNSTAPPTALAAARDTFAYTYDAAQNLLARGVTEDRLPETAALPLDASGRNRPASVGGVPLAWDANGNLAAKGDLPFSYDERNRLTRVAQASGAEIARYDYDAFNRRVRTVRPGSTEETAWAGWQAVEIYRDGVLRERRTWGVGLDEAVRLETDADGDGVLDTTQLPIYDSTGNLVALTDPEGRPIELYEYSPFGERTITVDLTPPVVEQVRSAGGELVVEISEEISAEVIAAAVAAGDFALVETNGGSAIPIEVTQPVNTGRQARRRLIVTTTDPPPAATELQLAIAPTALVDRFLNRLAEPFELTFPWPTTDTVLLDSTPPRLAQILVRNGRLEIELSEEPDLTAAAAAITVDGAAVSWILSDDRYRLVAGDELGAGSHQVDISTAPLDLAGLGLNQVFNAEVTLDTGTESRIVHQAPDPRVVASSTVANALGFKGLPHDPDTGLVLMRHRYFDPELGRFLTPDPMGYSDSPNPYQYALNNPFIFGDPFGLEVQVQVGSYTFIVEPALEAYVKQRFGFVIGFWAEGYDRYRALRDMDHGSMLPPLIERAGLEAAYALRIYNRLYRAYLRGGADGFWVEHQRIIDEVQLKLEHEARHMPVGQTVYAYVDAANAESDFEKGMYGGRGAFRFLEDLALLFGLRAAAARPAVLTTQTGWTLPEGGGGAWIRGRWYTEHALERMAPRIPQVMAELERRALARARAAGLEPGTPEFQRWWTKYGPDPRNIPPSVVEAEIANPGSTGVRVIKNAEGGVVTVIPGGG